MISIHCKGGTTKGITIAISETGQVITQDIRRMTVNLEPNDIVTATVDLATHGLDIEAHPLLGLDTLREAAKHYGLHLVTEQQYKLACSMSRSDNCK